MTPEQFLERLKEIYKPCPPRSHYDPEWCHGKADELMEELLLSLGYGEGIEFLRKERWYS